MKPILILLILGSYTFLFSQNCDPKDISTNFLNPKNSERPTLRNFFNWQREFIPLAPNNILNNTSGSFKNPYWDQSIQPARTDYAHDDKSDFYNEDGWELIRYENGFRQNGSITNSRNFAPMFVLFNKYKSIMRVIVNPGFNDDFIKGVIAEINILQFPKNSNIKIPYISASANFGYMSSPSSTLGDTADVTKFSVPCKWYGKRNFVIAEFPIAYDPCVCNNHVYFNFKFKGLKSSTIELSGRFIGQSQSLLDNKGEWIRNWLPTVWDEGLNKNSGVLTFNQTQSFLEMYKQRAKELEKWNATNGVFQPIFEKILSFGFDKIGGGLSSLILSDFAKYYIEANKNDSLLKNIKEEDIIKLGKSAMNVGGDFLSTYIGEKLFGTKPVLPTAPHVLWGEIALKGKLTDSAEANEAEFRIPAPGSFEAEKRNELKNVGITDTGVASYPLYNERLGVFNLLNKPKLYFQDLPSYTHGFYTRRFMYLDDINIAVNPKLDIKDAKFFVTLELELEKVPILKAVYSNGSTALITRINPFVSNGTSTIVRVDTLGYYLPVSDIDSFEMTYADQSNPNVLTFFDTLTIKYPKGKEWMRTGINTLAINPYPAKEISRQIFEYSYDAGLPFDGTYYFNLFRSLKSKYKRQFVDTNYKLWHVPIKNVYFKITGEFTFNSIGKDGQNNRSIIVNKYKLDTFRVNNIASITNLRTDRFRIKKEFTFCNTQSIPKELILNTIFFQRDTIIYADRVIINGRLSSNINVSVKIYANEIVTNPGGGNSPSIELIPGIPEECVTEIIRDDFEIDNFCTIGGGYKANNFTAKSVEISKRHFKNIEESIAILTLAPNPAKDIVNVKLDGYQNSSVSLKVYDLLGREALAHVEKDIKAKTHTIQLNTESLLDGTYFVKVWNGFEEKTEKLMINRQR
jgi:hypothetical protein